MLCETVISIMKFKACFKYPWRKKYYRRFNEETPLGTLTSELTNAAER